MFFNVKWLGNICLQQPKKLSQIYFIWLNKNNVSELYVQFSWNLKDALKKLFCSEKVEQNIYLVHP